MSRNPAATVVAEHLGLTFLAHAAEHLGGHLRIGYIDDHKLVEVLIVAG